MSPIIEIIVRNLKEKKMMDINSCSFSIIYEYGVNFILSAYVTISYLSFIQEYLKLKSSTSKKFY